MSKLKSDRNIQGLTAAINAHENGRYCIHDLGWCVDTAAWLHKFNPKLRTELEPLIDRITELLK